MRFALLGSGSRGNALAVGVGDTYVVVDCGFSAKVAEQRLLELGVKPEQLVAILVTHEHTDHIKGVAALAKKYKLPVYLSGGTNLAWQNIGVAESTLQQLDVRIIDTHTTFEIGDLTVQPVPVPHDAREPCQYIFSAQGKRLGLLTDVGWITPHIVEQYQCCDALLLEFNHDSVMLQDGPYPPKLKNRVAGDYGHLNNAQAAGLLTQIETAQLQHLIAVHISEKNNAEALVRESIQRVVTDKLDVMVLAKQDEVMPWKIIA